MVVIRFASLVFIFHLSSAFVLPRDLNIVPRDLLPREADNLDEAVFLLQCTRWQRGQESPSGIKDYIWLNENADNPTPQFYFDFPHDPTDGNGHIDWTVGTAEAPITALLNKQKFKVWDLCKTDCVDKKKDEDNQGSPGYLPPNGRAELEGADMRCYQIAKPFTQKLTHTTYYDCTANYYCTHEERKVRRTIFDVKDTTVEVIIARTQDSASTDEKVPDEMKQWIVDAFENLNVVHDKAVPTNDAIFKIKNSQHQMQYFVDLVDQKGDVVYDPDRIKNITSHLTDKLAQKIIDDGKFDQCQAGWAAKYFTCYWRFRFPAQIDIKVQTSKQSEDDWYKKDHVLITTTNWEDKEDSCKKDGALAKEFAGVFGVLAFGTGAAGALAKGLGAIFGGYGAAECGEIPLWPN